MNAALFFSQIGQNNLHIIFALPAESILIPKEAGLQAREEMKALLVKIQIIIFAAQCAPGSVSEMLCSEQSGKTIKISPSVRCPKEILFYYLTKLLTISTRISEIFSSD